MPKLYGREKKSKKELRMDFLKKHPDYFRNYYYAHKAVILERNREWRKNNPDYYKKYFERYERKNWQDEMLKKIEEFKNNRKAK